MKELVRKQLYQIALNNQSDISDLEISAALKMTAQSKLDDDVSINCLFHLLYTRHTLASEVLSTLRVCIGDEAVIRRLSIHHFYYPHLRVKAVEWMKHFNHLPGKPKVY